MKRLLSALVLCVVGIAASPAANVARPNIIFIIADDLGIGDLSCYGQKRFRTPNIDRLATEGMKLTVHYSGSPVCAPSRCVLMTGKHPGHATIRDNRQHQPGREGQWPVNAGDLKLPLTLKNLGYTTGAFGKWGLGAPGTAGEPLRQGIDRFYGYNCQAIAHNYYPTSLWDNSRRVPLNNPSFAAHQRLPEGANLQSHATYARFSGKDYAPDLIGEQAMRFIRENKARPFFLFYPTTVPHLALQVPEDSLAEFAGKFAETPYAGGRSYLPHRTPRAAFAGMITRMDREVGRVLDLLKELGLEQNTIVAFTSDNGPLNQGFGGTDSEFFDSAKNLRGFKGSLYEGGVRVPCLVRWPGKIAPGTESARVTGFEDWLPTLFELAGAKDRTPRNVDGISFAPTLLGKKQEPRAFLYREFPGYGGQQSVRAGDWKVVRQRLHAGPRAKLDPGPLKLYNLADDPSETTDIAAKHPDVVEKLAKIMREQHVKSETFPIRALDDPASASNN